MLKYFYFSYIVFICFFLANKICCVFPALFYSSVNDTDAPDWLSHWCSDEINQWTNKTTPFTARDVTIFIATSNFEIQNSLSYNISVENARLNYLTTNICPFREQKLLKITLLQLFQWKTHHRLLCQRWVCHCVYFILVHRRAEPGWIGESPMKDWWI